MKLCIVGGGSTYNIGLFEAMSRKKEELPIETISLMDIDKERLTIMGNFLERMVRHKKFDWELSTTTDLEEGVVDSDFVISSIRPGGNYLRGVDEKISVKHGIIGQETTGPTGFAFALRTIVPSINIGKAVEKSAPEAWLISATNPAGIMTEAILNHTRAKALGICHCGIQMEHLLAQKVFRVKDPNRVKIIWAGINHLGFVLEILMDGRELPPDEIIPAFLEFNSKLPEYERIAPELIRAWRGPYFIPGPYWNYWFHQEKLLEHQRQEKTTRGDTVTGQQKNLFECLKDEKYRTWGDLPLEIRGRGSSKWEREESAETAFGGYIPGLIGVMDSIYNNKNELFALNVLNNGVIKALYDNASVEVSGILNKSGFHPFHIGELPPRILALIQPVKAYETLTIKAAVEGNYDLAIRALMAHPMVVSYDKAKALLNDFLKADKDYLPQFESAIEKQ